MLPNGVVTTDVGAKSGPWVVGIHLYHQKGPKNEGRILATYLWPTL